MLAPSQLFHVNAFLSPLPSFLVSFICSLQDCPVASALFNRSLTHEAKLQGTDAVQSWCLQLPHC